MDYCVIYGIRFDLKTNILFYMKILFELTNSVDPGENAESCSISSMSSVFVNSHVKGYPVYKS